MINQENMALDYYRRYIEPFEVMTPENCGPNTSRYLNGFVRIVRNGNHISIVPLGTGSTYRFWLLYGSKTIPYENASGSSVQAFLSRCDLNNPIILPLTNDNYCDYEITMSYNHPSKEENYPELHIATYNEETDTYNAALLLSFAYEDRIIVRRLSDVLPQALENRNLFIVTKIRTGVSNVDAYFSIRAVSKEATA